MSRRSQDPGATGFLPRLSAAGVTFRALDTAADAGGLCSSQAPDTILSKIPTARSPLGEWSVEASSTTVAQKTFRVFISSTFSDLVRERDALREEVYPALRDY